MVRKVNHRDERCWGGVVREVRDWSEKNEAK